MIYILIEINGFRQLKKIDNIFTDQIVEYMTSTFSRDECNLLEHRNSIFVFACNPGENDLISLFNNTINLFTYLKSISPDLMGYNILLDQALDIYSEDLSRTLFSRLFSLQKDESFYIGSGIISFFDSFADFEQEEDFFKMISFHEKALDNEDNIVSVLSQSKEMEKYLEYLSPFINNDKQGLIFYYGKNISGNSILSFCIAGLLEGKDVDVPWLYLKPDRSEISAILPLINCMDNQFLIEVPSYLNEPELSVWNQKYHFIKNANSIIYDEDIIILFRIYLKAYSLRMAELLMPPMVFILDSHDFNELTFKYIASILEDLYLDLDLITVLFSEDEDIPSSFHGFQGKKIILESWDINEEKSLHADSPVSYYHSILLQKIGNGLLNGSDATKSIVKNLEHSTKQFLVIYTLFYDLCEKDEIISYLYVDQSDKYKYENFYTELVAGGLIYPGEKAFPVFTNIKKDLKYNFSSEDIMIINNIVSSIIDKSVFHEVIVFEKIANIYRLIENYSKEAQFLLIVINLLVITGRTKTAGVFFERIAVLLRMDLIDKNIIELKQHIYFLKAAIFENKDDFASDVYLRLSRMESDDIILNSERLIVCSEYLFAMYKYKKSLNLAKLALLDIQDSDDSELKTLVNLNLARILMGMKRIDESKDYFKIAKETVNREKDLYPLLEINSHEAVVNFIYGNFSESLRLVNDSLIICHKSGRRDWELFLMFLHGRIYFELGNYSDAVVQFSEGLRQCDIYMESDKKSLFNIWLGRTYIYLKDVRYGLKILNNFDNSAEALYFSAEGLFFKEEYNNAFDKINQAFILERDRNRFFCSSNIISWESGYDFIEDRSLVIEGGYGVLFQLIRAFKAFLMSKTNNEKEGRLELARLTREERLSEIDLNNGFYYYLHSLTLPEYTGAEAVDRLTLLSKALRHIQKTASNIDNPKHRQMYLSLNYWNSGLMEEGRVHKLI